MTVLLPELAIASILYWQNTTFLYITGHEFPYQNELVVSVLLAYTSKNDYEDTCPENSRKFYS